MVVQNGMPDILRAIESLSPVCDEIFVVDGGSRDGTLEFLRERASIYKLRLFERPFDTMQKQRQFLLDKTPQDSWVIALDQDEKLSIDLERELKSILLGINEKELKDPARKFPFICKVAHIMLVNDL